MNATDLFSLRAGLQQTNTLLCFNGPISRGLLEEFGNALKRYLELEQAQSTQISDVFSVYIEMTQNIRRYALSRGYDDNRATATVIISRSDDGHYMVSAGNVVCLAHGQALAERIRGFAGLDKAQLKAAYKEQLRKPRDPANPEAVGLGLIEIARRATAPLQASLTAQEDGDAFFSLSVII